MRAAKILAAALLVAILAALYAGGFWVAAKIGRCPQGHELPMDDE